MIRARLRPGLAAALAASLVALVGACTPAGGEASTAPSETGSQPTTSGASSTATLTVYTDQHASLVEALTKAYTDATGVKFNIQQDATVGQIEAEGAASPADVFLSEDPGPVARLEKAGLTTALDAATIDQVRPGLSSPNAMWVAYAARARVLYYNPTLIGEADLPRTLADITADQYKGKFTWAPSGAFVATTQYLISTIGVEKTTAFLEKVRDNGVNEQKNGNVRDTVEAGTHAMGLSNHYYWWIKAAQVGGADKMVSKIYHFPETDPGNLVLSSGAAILKSGKNQEEAAKFLAWLTSTDGGQAIISSGDIDVSGAQYPVAPGSTSAIVGSLDDIASPSYDMSIYGDQSQAEDLLKSLGMSS